MFLFDIKYKRFKKLTLKITILFSIDILDIKLKFLNKYIVFNV